VSVLSNSRYAPPFYNLAQKAQNDPTSHSFYIKNYNAQPDKYLSIITHNPTNMCTEFRSETENLRSPINSMEDNQNL